MRYIINRLKQPNIDYISIIKGYLFGLLGALTVFSVAHFYGSKPVKIATVNITGIVDEFIKQESAKHIPEQTLKADVKHYGDLLEKELKLFSRETNLVLLPSEAVIAGGHDYTTIINKRLASKIKSENYLNVE